jgi:hypothetical protein
MMIVVEGVSEAFLACSPIAYDPCGGNINHADMACSSSLPRVIPAL